MTITEGTMKVLFATCLVFLLLGTGCSSSIKKPNTATPDGLNSNQSQLNKDYKNKAMKVADRLKTLNLCGEYKSNAESKLVKSFTFLKDNLVNVNMGMLFDYKYHLAGDEIVIRTDKAYLRLKIENDRLIGNDEFTKNEIFVKQASNNSQCDNKTVSSELVTSLAHELCYSDGVTLQGQGQFKSATEKYLECCESGAAISCNKYGFMTSLLTGDKEKAKKYFRKACDMGAGEGCGNLADIETKLGHHDAAIALHKEACDKGFVSSCMKSSKETYEMLR